MELAVEIQNARANQVYITRNRYFTNLFLLLLALIMPSGEDTNLYSFILNNLHILYL